MAAEHTFKDVYASTGATAGLQTGIRRRAETAERRARLHSKVADLPELTKYPEASVRSLARSCLAALDLASDAVMVVDRAGHIQYANSASQLLFERSQLAGLHFSEVLPLAPGTVRELVLQLRGCAQWRGELEISSHAPEAARGSIEPRPDEHLKAPLKHAGGASGGTEEASRKLELTVRAVRSTPDSGKPDSFSVLIRPIHGTHAMHTMHATHTRLDKRDRPGGNSARDVFATLTRVASEIAHDVNNQIAVVLNYSFILLRELPADRPEHAHVRELQRAAWQAAETARLLLRLGGKRGSEPTSLDVNQIVLAAHSTVALAARSHSAIEHRLDAGPCLAKTRRSLIEWLLIELTGRLRAKLGEIGLLRISTMRAPSSSPKSHSPSGADARKGSAQIRVQLDGYPSQWGPDVCAQVDPVIAAEVPSTPESSAPAQALRTDTDTGERTHHARFELSLYELPDGGLRYAIDLPSA